MSSSPLSAFSSANANFCQHIIAPFDSKHTIGVDKRQIVFLLLLPLPMKYHATATICFITTMAVFYPCTLQHQAAFFILTHSGDHFGKALFLDEKNRILVLTDSQNGEKMHQLTF